MKRVLNKVDKPLLILTIICLVFGLMMVGSASSLKAYMSMGDSYHYFKRQLLFIIVGLLAFFIVVKTPIKRYKSIIYVVVLGVIGALVYVLLKGDESNGIYGWINLGSVSIQPSEFAKIAIIL